MFVRVPSAMKMSILTGIDESCAMFFCVSGLLVRREYTICTVVPTVSALFVEIRRAMYRE